MARIKDENRQIPGGYSYVQPETGFQPTPWSSVDSITKQVMAHRQGNLYLAKKYQWPLDYETIKQQVLAYNAAVCEANGHTDFIYSAESVVSFQKLSRPMTNPSAVGAVAADIKQHARNTVSGLKLFTDWLGAGLKPVEQALAEKRSKVCETCPKNVLGNFWQQLEAVAASELRTLISIKSDLQLKLSNEDSLNSCSVCDCFISLKCFVPLDHILANTSEATMKAFPDHCWVKRKDAQPHEK
jgi:hypothetical protein